MNVFNRVTQILLVVVSWGVLGPKLAAQSTVVRLPAGVAPLDNPLKGWCPYTDAGTIYQPYSMVFQYISWRELEPVENDYRFAEWEKSWDEGAAKGRHIVFRVYIDYPSQSSGLPGWLRKSGIKERAYSDYGGGNSPDYDDPRLIAAMEKLITALGKRYNNDPRIAFVQVGLLGFWGEWHTYPRTELYPSKETERRVIEAYRRAFPDKQLMVRYARDYAGQQEWIGFHDDMFPEDTDNGMDWGFLAGLRREGRAENWRIAVIGGEMVPGKASQLLGRDFKLTNDMLERAHFTWVGPYCPALVEGESKEFEKRSEMLVHEMGYNFRMKELEYATKSEGRLSLKLTGENIGVAPFYYAWPVEFALLDERGGLVATLKADWDIRKWQPGRFVESIELQYQVPAGAYRLAIGVRDPWKDQPSIGFANALPVVKGWTVLTDAQIRK